MQCDAFQQRMDALLDDRQDVEADRLLCQHAEVCPACRESFQAHMELVRWTGGQVVTARSTKPTQGYRTLAAVAATIFCVWAWQVAQPRPAEPQPVAVIDSAPPATPRAKLYAPPQDLDPYLMHQPLVSLGLLSLGDWSDTMREVPIPFGATLPAVDTDWVDAVTTGMTPIQSSLSTTWDAIRRTVTPGEERPAELELRG